MKNKNLKPILLIAIVLLMIISFWLITLKLNLENGWQFSQRSGLTFEELKSEIGEILNKSPLTKKSAELTDEQIKSQFAAKLAEELNSQKHRNTETQDWLTYTNESYKFEVEIPVDLISEEISTKELWFSTQEQVNARIENITNCSDDNLDTICEPEMLSTQLIFTAYLPEENEDEIEEETIDLNGILWHKFKLLGDLHPTIYFGTINGENEYFFSSYLTEEETNQILSTFKFLD